MWLKLFVYRLLLEKSAGYSCAHVPPLHLCHALNANADSSQLPGSAVPTGRSVLRQVVNHTHLLANLLCL